MYQKKRRKKNCEGNTQMCCVIKKNKSQNDVINKTVTSQTKQGRSKFGGKWNDVIKSAMTSLMAFGCLKNY